MRLRRRRCEHQGDGHARGATPLRDRPYWFWHDPKRLEDAQEARHLGGLRRKREQTLAGAYDFEGLNDVPAIRRLLEIAALGSLSLENGVARNRTIITAASSWSWANWKTGSRRWKTLRVRLQGDRGCCP